MRKRNEMARSTAGILAPYLVFGAILGTTWVVLWQIDKKIISKATASNPRSRVRRRKRN